MNAEVSQFEADELLKLLTEALRAGPGSPQWHEAVLRLRSAGGQDADEFRLLLTAREDLESGREYRSVRAGPGFTRKVMESVEAAASARPRLPSANLIALLAGIAILAVVVLVGIALLRNPGQKSTLDDLKGAYFSRIAVSSDFSQAIPSEWKRFGVEPVISRREGALRGGFDKGSDKEYRGGGLYLVNALGPAEAFAIEATVHMRNPSNQVDLQLFVAEEPSFDNPKAASPRELVVDLREGQLSVFKPDVTTPGEPLRVKGTIPLTVKLDREFVVVEADKKVVYAGPHGLTADKPRWPGVRFLTRGEKGLDDVTVQTLRVLKP